MECDITNIYNRFANGVFVVLSVLVVVGYVCFACCFSGKVFDTIDNKAIIGEVVTSWFSSDSSS